MAYHWSIKMHTGLPLVICIALRHFLIATIKAINVVENCEHTTNIQYIILDEISHDYPYIMYK